MAKCSHVYGYSLLCDCLVYEIEDEQKCLNDENQQFDSAYQYEQFNYCPECGKKIKRKKCLPEDSKPHMWKYTKTERNRMIKSDRQSGMTYKALAEKYGISESRVIQIIRKKYIGIDK